MTFLRLRVAVCGVFAGVLAAAGPAGSAQQPTSPATPAAGHETSAASVASYPLSRQMPVDPEVVVGTLPNGLRYYVRANGKPAHRAELRLVVKAGSVLEDDGQQGLAHFVEHMEFEGTRHFPRQSIEKCRVPSNSMCSKAHGTFRGRASSTSCRRCSAAESAV